MTNEQKAQAFLDEYNELTKKHGLALRPTIKPDFELIVLNQGDKIDSKAPQTPQDDSGDAPSDSE